MDKRKHEDKQEVDHQDGLREIPGDLPETQPGDEVVEDEGDEEQDEQPELGGSGPVIS
jgi:hypothetical protein